MISKTDKIIKKINLVQKLNDKEFRILESIVDFHIRKNQKNLKSRCLIRFYKFDIIRFYSDYISKKNDKYTDNNFNKSSNKYIFPNMHIQKKRIIVNFDYSQYKKIIWKKRSFLQKIKIFLVETLSLIFNKGKLVGLLDNTIPISELIFYFISKRYQIYFMKYEKIAANEMVYQKENLKNLFKEIDIKLKIPKQLDSNYHLFKFFDIHTSNKNKLENKKIDLLISGHFTSVANRIRAYNCKNNFYKTKIIGIAHGHNWIWDEPYNEIAEYEYSDYYLSYGKPRNINSKVLQKLFYKTQIIGSSCDIIKKIKDQDYKIDLSDKELSEIKFLYVPREYQVNGYLPHHMSDQNYNLWHKILFEKFTDYNVTIKLHPKRKSLKHDSFFSKKFILEKEIKIEKIFNKYDVLIFDTLTSALTKTIATNKPIIFFNIHERKTSINVMKILKKRVIYNDMHKIQNFKISKIKFKPKYYLNDEFINRYSLYKNKKRSSTLFELINKI